MKSDLWQQEPRVDWQRIQQVVRLLNASKGSVGLVVGLGLLSSLFEGISLYLFLPILAHLPDQSSASASLPAMLSWVDSWLPEDRIFVGLLGIAVLGIVIKNVITYVNVAVFAYVNCRAGHLLRSRLHRQILSASSSHMNQSQSGKIANAMISETWRSVEALGELFRILVAACALVVLTGVLSVVSWSATLIVMAVGLLFIALSRAITRATNRASAEAVSANTDFIGRFWETMEGLQTIRQFGQAETEAARFDTLSHRVEKVYLRLQLISNVIAPTFEVLAAIFIAVLLLLMFQFGISGPSVAVFLLVLFRAARSMRVLMTGFNKLRQLAHAVEEVNRVGEACEGSALVNGDKVFSNLSGNIRLCGVAYQYPGRTEGSLQGIDMEFPAGRSIALVGRSGSGKTTIARLLCREFDPTEGIVQVDGTDLREVDMASWRRHVAIVPQVTHIFDGTIADNIAYGAEQADEAAILDAAKQAQCDEFVQDLPQGYSTWIGSKGVLLSGGQRQRIAFARALLMNPRVLILDEATNELDSRTEAKIMKTLRDQRRNMTTVIVAHRLSTITWCDTVFVMADGTVAEHGSPTDLMARDDSEFAQMIRHQRQVG